MAILSWLFGITQAVKTGTSDLIKPTDNTLCSSKVAFVVKNKSLHELWQIDKSGSEKLCTPYPSTSETTSPVLSKPCTMYPKLETMHPVS